MFCWPSFNPDNLIAAARALRDVFGKDSTGTGESGRTGRQGVASVAVDGVSDRDDGPRSPAG